MATIKDIRSKVPKGSRRSISRIRYIARHHSATPSGDFWAFWNNRWKGLGWRSGGYHCIILRDGTVQLCYNPEYITNGIRGHNTNTYHICVVGNGSFTPAQERAWSEIVQDRMAQFNVPASRVLGHNEFSNTSTACPGINMGTVRNNIRKGRVTSASSSSTGGSGTANSDSSRSYLQKGDRGTNVKSLQNLLIRKGFALSEFGADGSFGDETEKAVKEMQKKAGIKIDGLYGKKSEAALNKMGNTGGAATISVPSGSPIMKRGSKGNTVTALQHALNKAGYSVGSVDGIFGPKTHAGVTSLQRAAGIAVDGVYGPQSAKALRGRV